MKRVKIQTEDEVVRELLADLKGDRQVATISKGSVVGEQSMLTGQPASATVACLSFCELSQFDCSLLLFKHLNLEK